jgi:hypothetical protein
MDVTARYIVNRRVSVVASLPIAMNHFSMIYPPLGDGKGIRHGTNALGIGDMTFYTQSWLFKPQEHPFGNVAVGVGLKVPTGDWNEQGILPNLGGSFFQQRAVYPPAIMPGDGGTGIIFGFDSFKVFRKPPLLRGTTVFASASYLANPRDTNGTASIVQNLGVPLAPQYLGSLVNSVPDTYTATIGASIKVPGTWDKPKLRGLRFRLTGHCEGLNSRDLMGRSHGYRQPGWAMSVAPGLTYTNGRNMLIAEVPIIFLRHVNGERSSVPGLPGETASGAVKPSPFKPDRNLGLIAPVAVSVRYVRTF